jgi:hypothetical protein
MRRQNRTIEKKQKTVRRVIPKRYQNRLKYNDILLIINLYKLQLGV